MRGSWKIAQFAGIGVFVHWSFLILPLLVGFSAYSSGTGFWGVIDAIIFVLAIFGCVVLHEFGHALTARRFGIGTHDITLYPIGGVARLERMPRRPSQEIAVALAGPAVNVVIAAVLFAGIALTMGASQLVSFSMIGGSLPVKLFWANVVLVIFNMLPAFPMDGGRVLRALLATQLSYTRATQVASIVGQVMAVMFAVVGLLTNGMLVVLALFIFLAARGEAAAVRRQSYAERAKAGDAMQRQFSVVSANSRLDEVAQTVLFVPQNDFPVIHGGQFVGMLAKGDLLHALSQGHSGLCVANIMRRDVPAVDYEEPLDETAQRMQSSNLTSVPVTSYGQLVGVLTSESLQRWVSYLGMWRGYPPSAIPTRGASIYGTQASRA